MATNTSTTTDTRDFNVPEQYKYKYASDYSSDWDNHRLYIQTFDAYEAMLMGQVFDSVSNSVDGGRITDSYTTTLAKERADRVMAKLPTGNVVSLYKSKVGQAAFMDILRQKWIYPNANAQHSFVEKLNMWQFYSSVYGYMPMFYDWNIALNGYVGPDCWLWNPRNLVPQSGRASINDMEYVTALTTVSKSYLLDILEEIGETSEEEKESAGTDPSQPSPTDANSSDSGWNVEALKILIQIAGQTTHNDIQRDSKVVRDRNPANRKKGVLLATRYEAGPDGEWVTFAPEHGMVEVRRLKNPHKNGRIPFVIKYSQPLFDSFYGLGDFQRAKPIQFARDGLTNFYFKGIKMNLLPPLVANANGVLKHTLDYREGSVMLETIPNSIRRLETSTAGLATYNAAQESLTGSLLSLFGSQNAAISASDSNNPSQGKTPQAINLYSDKEATRDGSERRHLEDAIQQLTNGFFTLVANIGTEAIPVALLGADVQDIIDQGYTDVTELFKDFRVNESGTAIDLKIDPKQFKDLDLRFVIDPDSTAQTNQQAIMQSIQSLMENLGKVQNVLTQDPGISVHWDLIMAQYEAVSGIPGAKKFITYDEEASKQAKLAKANQGPQLENPIKLPNGNQIEMADLVKLFDGADDHDVDFKNAILMVIGIPAVHKAPPETPGAPEGPGINQPGATVTSTGNTFNDPHIAAAAEALSNIETPPMAKLPEPNQPTVTSSGHAFNDATIASAAEAIHGMQPPAQPSKA